MMLVVLEAPVVVVLAFVICIDALIPEAVYRECVQMIFKRVKAFWNERTPWIPVRPRVDAVSFFKDACEPANPSKYPKCHYTRATALNPKP